MTQSAVDLSPFQNKFSQFMCAMVELANGHRADNPTFRENFKYGCYEEILQIYGKMYEPISDEDYPLKRKHGDPELRWKRSLQIANTYPNLIYTEGLAIIKDEEVPIDHAWLIDAKTGKVVDPTFRNEALSYFGITFKLDFAMGRAEETGVCGIFPVDLESKSPILMNGIPEDCLWTPANN
jgi:hypothetical protein